MKTIPTTKGMVTIVDDEDYEWASQFKWYASKGRGGSHYASRKILVPADGGGFRDISRQMQRDLLDPKMTLPKAIKVDHRNGDTLDNRRDNLRLSTNSQSNANRHGFNAASGFKGVHYVPNPNLTGKRGGGKNPYRVMSRLNGRIYYGRPQSDPISAAREYNRLALELHGEFARLNVIPGDDQ